MIDTVAIFKAKQELNKFLNEHPHLKAFQKQIDEQLKSAGNDHNRRVVLTRMIVEHLTKLANASKELYNAALPILPKT